MNQKCVPIKCYEPSFCGHSDKFNKSDDRLCYAYGNTEELEASDPLAPYFTLSNSRLNACTQCALQQAMFDIWTFVHGGPHLERILPYFLQSKDLLHHYIFNAYKFAQDSNASDEEEHSRLTCNQMQSMMYWISTKHRALRWFCELEDGLYFRNLVIGSYFRYLRPSSNMDVIEIIGLPILLHLTKHKDYYLNKAQRKQSQTKGVVQKNYQWIYDFLTKGTGEFILDDSPVEDQEWKTALKRSWRGQSDMKCDNRECDRTYLKGWDKNLNFDFKRCGRCRMMHYCSRRCQKIDWNRYNHRKLCFQYQS